MKTKLGVLIDKPSIQVHKIGESVSKTGEPFDLCAMIITHEPIIRSQTTGQQFRLRWAEIFALAIQKGLK